MRQTLACGPPMNDRRLEQRVAAVAEAALPERGFVTAIDIFLGLGWLAPSSEQAWRQGRTPYLEKVVTANLSKITTPEGDGAAIDVAPVLIDAEHPDRAQRDRGEGLVDLPDVDVPGHVS